MFPIHITQIQTFHTGQHVLFMTHNIPTLINYNNIIDFGTQCTAVIFYLFNLKQALVIIIWS